jgi:hypothetical protein
MCRELWSTYSLDLDSQEVNFYFVKKQFELEYPKAAITEYFKTVNESDWFKYLNGARNRVEHGIMLMLEFRGDSGQLVIADDQNVETERITTHKQYEPVIWCQTIFEETSRFIDICSRNLVSILY